MVFDKYVNSILETYKNYNKIDKSPQFPMWLNTPFNIIYGRDYFNLFQKEADKDYESGLQHTYSYSQYYTFYIPIMGKFKDILYYKTGVALHSTDAAGAIQVYKNQNDDAFQLSSTTSHKIKNPCSDGVHRRGILLKLRGNLYFPTPDDQMSLVDLSGYRWVNIKKIENSSAIVAQSLTKVNEFIKNKIRKLQSPLSENQKQQFVKDYLKFCWPLVVNIKDEIQEYIHTSRKQPAQYARVNEIIISNYEIEGAKICKNSRQNRTIAKFLQSKGIEVQMQDPYENADGFIDVDPD
jgi:hypothetical protein